MLQEADRGVMILTDAGMHKSAQIQNSFVTIGIY